MLNKFHSEILNKDQEKLLPVVKSFSRSFYLVGGTAIALYLGHRESIDFDLFKYGEFNNSSINTKFKQKAKIDKEIRSTFDQLTLVSSNVHFTFLYFPYKIEALEKFREIIKMPTLLTLASMKAFALGGRNKWKDYVDLYFILRDHYKISDIVKEARKNFGSEFNEKLFRSQLVYFKDINYKESVIFKEGFKVGDKEIQKSLIEFSLEK
ncbi:nucleotidyl transferase AbiEii/AbiGii toxin family protein [Patescibacteria group bacterium]|nr:nucleotidyl transferase AbiEii/AbiGii toxin family protein [Patescibacteria group bacterium]